MEHQHSDARPAQGWLTTINAPLARSAMYIGVAGLLAIVGIVVNAVLPGKDYTFSNDYSNGKKKRA